MDKKNSQKSFPLRIPEKLHSIIMQKASETGISMNAMILHILWNWAKRVDKGA